MYRGPPITKRAHAAGPSRSARRSVSPHIPASGEGRGRSRSRAGPRSRLPESRRRPVHCSAFQAARGSPCATPSGHSQGVDRRALLADGSAFTVDSLACYFPHNALHHLWDIRPPELIEDSARTAARAPQASRRSGQETSPSSAEGHNAR